MELPQSFLSFDLVYTSALVKTQQIRYARMICVHVYTSIYVILQFKIYFQRKHGTLRMTTLPKHESSTTLFLTHVELILWALRPSVSLLVSITPPERQNACIGSSNPFRWFFLQLWGCLSTYMRCSALTQDSKGTLCRPLELSLGAALFSLMQLPCDVQVYWHSRL